MPAYLQAGDRQVNLSEPVCMGVINLTPDSFSDGALLANATASDFCVDLDKALDHAEAMVEAGAAILDIGGESTRPGAAEVSESEELERVLPLVEAVASRLDVCISVDTSSPSVMSQAIAAGAHLINDVRALSCKGAVEVVAQSSAAACLMHMRGSPATMQDNTEYDDVVAEVYAFLASRLNECIDNGIARDRLLADPGFGFGKNAQQNFLLLKQLPRLQELGVPVLVGISRKSMIGDATGRSVHERLPGSIAAATLALQGGASIIRSHDVAATVDAIRVNCAYRQA